MHAMPRLSRQRSLAGSATAERQSQWARVHDVTDERWPRPQRGHWFKRRDRRGCVPPTPTSPAVPWSPARPSSGVIDASRRTQRTGRHQDLRTEPDVLTFANWFADWWLRRGRDLTDPAGDRAP
jgi:hypothetical protein